MPKITSVSPSVVSNSPHLRSSFQLQWFHLLPRESLRIKLPSLCVQLFSCNGSVLYRGSLFESNSLAFAFNSSRCNDSIFCRSRIPKPSRMGYHIRYSLGICLRGVILIWQTVRELLQVEYVTPNLRPTQM